MLPWRQCSARWSDGLYFTMKDVEMLVRKVDSASLEECLDLGIVIRA